MVVMVCGPLLQNYFGFGILLLFVKRMYKTLADFRLGCGSRILLIRRGTAGGRSRRSRRWNGTRGTGCTAVIVVGQKLQQTVAILSNGFVFLQFQAALGTTVQACNRAFLRKFVAARCGLAEKLVVNIFSLLPLPVPKVLTGLTLGHCIVPASAVAVLRPRGRSPALPNSQRPPFETPVRQRPPFTLSSRYFYVLH